MEVVIKVVVLFKGFKVGPDVVVVFVVLLVDVVVGMVEVVVVDVVAVGQAPYSKHASSKIIFVLLIEKLPHVVSQGVPPFCSYFLMLLVCHCT